MASNQSSDSSGVNDIIALEMSMQGSLAADDDILVTEEREMAKEEERRKKQKEDYEEKQARKPLLEQWLDIYWDNYISDYRDIYFTDVATHDLVNKLLLIGDEQLTNLKTKPFKSPVTGKRLNVYDPVK